MKSMIEIYYIEDDENIASAVKEYFEKENMRVCVFSTIADAKQAFITHIPDIVLMDWNMPDGQGDEVCKWIRSKWEKLPIIFLTVRSDNQNIVSGFDNGADDYVVKPFAFEVLHSRIMAVLRRATQIEQACLYCDEVILDKNKNKISVIHNGEEVPLSQPEYQLLLILMENKGKTVTRKQLLEQIWDCTGNYVNDNTLTVTMKRLRKKLNNPVCIKTIRSFGYRMEDTI